MKLQEIIRNNTISFYADLDEKNKGQEDIENQSFEMCKKSLSDILEMFDEIGIDYRVSNNSGKLYLETAVLEFDETLEKNTLILEMFSELKSEQGKDVVYTSCRLVSQGGKYTNNTLFTSNEDLSLSFSNEILRIIQVRKLKNFVNHFDRLYTLG